ncbi:MAG: lysylphosphatidylglycerol synthase transmembrane domain-containing protein [Thermomicrobiales bacterium]
MMGMIPGTTERSGVDKRGRLLIGVVLTAFFLWLALRNVDLRAVREALRSASYIYLIPAALSSLLGYCVRTARWGRILAPIKKAPFGRLFPVLMAGFAANNLLPARIGEFVRAFLLGREEDVSTSLALATIVVERVCDGITLLALMALTLVFFPIPETNATLQRVEIGATAIFGVAAVCLILLVLAPQLILRLTTICLRPFPRGLTARVEGILSAFIAGLSALKSPGALASLAGLSLLVWLFEGGAFACVLLAFPFGLARSEWLAAAIFLLVFVNLGIMIPSAPGYIGTYQFFAKLALGAFAVAAAPAIGLSFVAHALQYTLITGTGLLCLWRLGLTPGALSGMARAPEPAVLSAGAVPEIEAAD